MICFLIRIVYLLFCGLMILTFCRLYMVEKGKKSIGRGEAGGIALAKTYDGILASNNYKDIAPYIEKYNLKHTDTGQILREALDTRLITESEGNNIWAQMLAKRRKLPANSFSEYLADVNNSNSWA